MTTAQMRVYARTVDDAEGTQLTFGQGVAFTDPQGVWMTGTALGIIWSDEHGKGWLLVTDHDGGLAHLPVETRDGKHFDCPAVTCLHYCW